MMKNNGKSHWTPTIRSWSRFQNVMYIYFMCTQEQSQRERTLMNYYSSKLHHLQLKVVKEVTRHKYTS